MPTSTDLVTDLPADFEVFGQAVATSMGDLLGGTTGQILSKASNTDMDFTWIANDQGDITGITATSPLTGGGTSGAITVGIQASSTTQSGAVQLTDSTSSTSTTTAATPNSVKTSYDLANAAIPKSLVDAKGDILTATADNTPARLAVGTNGQTLVADSTASTGLAWSTPASGGMTLLSTTTLSGVSTTINITPTGYTYIYFTIAKMGFTGTGVPTPLITRINGTTSANYVYNNKDRDNTWTKGTSATGISSVNGYENSDAQYVFGTVMLPNQTTNWQGIQLTYYFASAANQGFGLTWGARETTQTALSSLTFLSSNGAATFVNSPQCLIYGVK